MTPAPFFAMRPLADSTDAMWLSSPCLNKQWAQVDVQDLLELLGRSFMGAQFGWLREFAVMGLRDRATDAELLSYLISLVQAIQYERVLQQPPAECPLASLLIDRAVANPELANFFHWCAWTWARVC